MEERIYKHLMLHEKDYISFCGETTVVDSIQLLKEYSVLQLQPQFQKISIPKVIDNIIEDFFLQYSIGQNILTKQELVSFISGAQDFYLSNRDEIEDELTKDFHEEKKEKAEILNLIEKFCFQDRNFVKEVTFKNHDGGRLRLRNYFVVADIYKSLIQFWQLDIESKENFQKQKIKLLEEVNQIKYNKRSVYAKHVIAQIFHQRLEFLNISQNNLIKIIGVFFNCAQIPLTDKNEFILSPVFTENFSEIVDYQLIRQLLNREPTYLLK